MSWLARSIANTLNLDNDAVPSPNPKLENQQTDNSSSPSRGVKEDLTDLTKTLTNQFWGVASFLAPPPQSDSYKPLDDSKSDPDEDEPDPAGIIGLQSDFSEISGRFKSGISVLSNNIAVLEIAKMASNLLQLGPDDEEDEKGFALDKGDVGVTEEVVAFVRDIAMHPETWLDFPLPENEDDEDFYLSDAQQEHALAAEHLAPRLAALRIELCPIYMSEARFWEIYFVLLHPRLDKQEAKLLSTPQVVKARASLAQELHKRTKPIEEDWTEKRTPKSNDNNDSRHEVILSVPSTSLSADVVQEMSGVESSTNTAVPIPASEKQPVLSSESQIVDKPVVEGLVTHGNVEKKPVISSEIQIVDKQVVQGGFITHNNVEKQHVISSEIQIVDKPVVGGLVTHGNVEKQPVTSSGIQIIDKSVVEGGLVTHKNVKPKSVSTSKLEESDEDDGDDWLKEETAEIAGVSKTTIPIDSEEDVSFSDLEEDDMDVPANFKKVNHSSDKDSQDWVQLRKSSTNLSKDANSFGSTKANAHTPDSKEPSDWLDVDDIEVA
ncbi:hypothetical protein K7X08_025787 [Anisodus acutangulus]|uniref:BSD domain-containing protein n=1 Tax=Anisodus acutangulus TaxID=402998 RepID=A0A9Q1QXG6_9SOLA|nr:hypothetical protein K7X08_025787 [Anisodus acutangulus]